MLLSVDLNPTLRRRFFVERLSNTNSSLNSYKKQVYPGGAGIELGIVAQMLSLDIKLMGFLGGINGSNIQAMLMESGFNIDYIEIKDNSAEIIEVVSSSDKILINEAPPKVSRDDLKELLKIYKENLNIYSNVAIVGEFPSNVDYELAYELVSMGKQWGRRVYLGLKIGNYGKVLDGKPFMCMLSVENLEDLTSLKLDYESEIIKATQYIFDKGIEFVVVDMGKRGVLVLNQEKGYSLTVPPFDKSDKKLHFGQMIAGFVLGFERDYDMETIVKLAQACGCIHCYDFKEEIQMSNIKSLMNRIGVRTFNNI